LETCFIAGSGDFDENVLPRPGDYIIAADGGYAALTARGFVPDLVCGDFDSLGYVPRHPNVVTYSDEKDETDLELAITTGLERGHETFVINGALGGRLDHVFGGVGAIARLARLGGRGFLAGKDMNVTVVRCSRARFTDKSRGFVSVFALGGQARGVTLRGLKYTMTGGVLRPDSTLGVSNEFTGAPCSVSVEDGILAVMWSGRLYETAAELSSP
jgi:thiamine pyrophosphokinase